MITKMKSATIFFCFICLLVVTNANNQLGKFQTKKDDTGYLLLTPSRFISSTSNRICLSRFAQTTAGTAFIQIELLPYIDPGEDIKNNMNGYSREKFITRMKKNFPAGNGGCFDIVIPKTPHLKLWLQFRMRLGESSNYIANTRRLISLRHPSSLVIIQTDKPVYRASETVRFRVLQLKSDLTPLQLPISSVYIEAPPEQFGVPVKLAQWSNVSTQMGLMQMDFTLDKYALKGDYRIVVDSQETGVVPASETFYVSEYSLPTFYVNVLFPQNVVLTFKQIVWTICARYMYGESVKGSLHIKVTSDAYNSQVIRKVIRLRHVRGCYNYTTRTQGLAFTNSLRDAPSVVVAEINVQEEGTRVWRNGTFLSHVGRQVLKIDFVNKNKLYLRPGLPYKAKVKVSDWDGKPVVAAKIKICHIPTNTDESENVPTTTSLNAVSSDTGDGQTYKPQLYKESCDTIYTDAKGNTHSTFNVPSDIRTKYLKIQATVLDHSLKDYEFGLKEYSSPVATSYINIWSSSSQVYVDIGSMLVSSGGLRLDSKHLIPIYIAYGGGQAVKAVTMHFTLITRSGVIFRWGSTTQCPTPVDVPNQNHNHHRQTSRNVSPQTVCYPASNHTGPYRINLPIRISHQMCPYSYVVAYFECDGEVVAASKMLKVNECFYKKIDQQWIPDEVPPSTPVRLRVQTPGPALCATLVTNLALNHAVPQLSTQQLIVTRLKAFMDSHQYGTDVFSSREICFKGQKTNSITEIYYKNTLLAFKTSSIDIVSDLIPETINCPLDQSNTSHNHNEPSDLTSRIVKERSFFPETWLWDLYLMYSNGTLDIDTNSPDDITRYDSQVFCISRSGVTCTQPSAGGILQVFQPFFVDLVVPKVVKRGEDAEMYYKIFNYMDDILTVTISLESTSKSFILITGEGIQSRSTQVICLGPQETRTEHFVLKAKRLGLYNVTVTAQIDNGMQYYCKHNVSLTTTLYDVRDKIVKQIKVEPEGYVMEKYKSALLCTNEFEKEANITFQADKVDAVQDSEQWIVSIVGDIAGPIVLNAEKLITLPMGCGEQNMALLAYNIMALDYLTASAELTHAVEQKTRENLLIGYQRQLTYRHGNGAFSAFGPSEDQGSTWLTAFTLKYLHKLRRHGVGWDGLVLQQAEQWLTQQQMENGCFRNVGQVFHREMKGGLRSDSSNVALGAYVLISLVDSGITINKKVIQNGIYCLTALKYKAHNFRRPTNVRSGLHLDLTYALALTTLARIRIEQYEWNQNVATAMIPKSNQLREKLAINKTFDAKGLASFIEMNDHSRKVNKNKEKERDIKREQMFASEKVEFSTNTNNSLHLLKSIAIRNGNMIWWEADSLSVSIETTGYAILSLLATDTDENWLDALAAVRWLSTHRNQNGGFMSTQDTLIALEAICAVSMRMTSILPELNVTVQGPATSHRMSVTSANRQTVHTVSVSDAIGLDPQRDRKLTVQARGEGCVLVQTTQKYNSVRVGSDGNASPFVLKSRITTDGLFGCRANRTWCKCAAILEVCVSWSHPAHEGFPEMAILEVELPSGYASDKGLLYQLIGRHNLLLRRLEERDDGRIIFYLSVSSPDSSSRPSQCWDVFLMGPRRQTLPARITLYDYYHTEVNATQTYTITESCPYDHNRTPHQEPGDLVLESSHLHQLITPVADFHYSDNTSGTDYARMVADDSRSDIGNIQIAIDIKTNMSINKVKTVIENDNMTSLNDGYMMTMLKDFVSKEINDTNVDKVSININNISNFVDIMTFVKENSSNSDTSVNNKTFEYFVSSFHIIDSELDLEVPEGLEGPERLVVLPPKSFVPKSEGDEGLETYENFPAYAIGHHFNWTDIETELDVPEGLEGNRPVWISPPSVATTAKQRFTNDSLSNNK